MLLFEVFHNPDDAHLDHLKKTGFWGRRAAGCLFLAQSTGRLCFALRSSEVQSPHTYGTWGGAIDDGENPQTAMMREVEEEIGMGISVLHIEPLYKFEVPNTFEYHNFLVIVPDEFHPELNWETDDYEWVDFNDWPRPLHSGVVKLLNHQPSVEKIMSLISQYADK